MINTKYNYYKTVKWKDIYTFKKYDNTVKVIAYYNTTNLNRLTDKLIMRYKVMNVVNKIS